MDAFFNALGTIFASGAGVLLLAVTAGAIFLVSDWRLALAGAVLIHLGLASVLVYVHNVAGVVAGGQVLAVVLSVAMLAIAGFLQPHGVSLHRAANWPLRSLALLFVLGAWWFMDPGYMLPYFSQPETELLIWSALCALALWSFSGSPLLGGVAVLLWSTLLYALAAVLLPNSGLVAIVGIADLFAALACSYLVLLEPSAQPGAARNLPQLAPRLRTVSARPWGLVRRAQPAVASLGPEPAVPAALPPTIPDAAPGQEATASKAASPEAAGQEITAELTPPPIIPAPAPDPVPDPAPTSAPDGVWEETPR